MILYTYTPKTTPKTTVNWFDKSHGTFAIRTPWIVGNAAVDQDAVTAVNEAITTKLAVEQSKTEESLDQFTAKNVNTFRAPSRDRAKS